MNFEAIRGYFVTAGDRGTMASAVSCAPPQTSAQTLPPTGWQIGNTVPEFGLVNPDGKLVSVSELRGKPVLINFWATWCSSCQLDMPYLQQVYNDWSGKGLTLFAIDSGESPAKVKDFFSANHLSLPVLFDFTGSTSDKYGVSAIPSTFFRRLRGHKTKVGRSVPECQGHRGSIANDNALDEKPCNSTGDKRRNG